MTAAQFETIEETEVEAILRWRFDVLSRSGYDIGSALLLASHIEIEPGRSGLDEVSYAKCEDVKSVSDQRLVTRLGSVVDETLFAIARALRFLLEL